MTKDQALDWLAWGIVGIAAGGLIVLVIRNADPNAVLLVGIMAAIMWAIIRLLGKALPMTRRAPRRHPPEPREGMD